MLTRKGSPIDCLLSLVLLNVNTISRYYLVISRVRVSILQSVYVKRESGHCLYNVTQSVAASGIIITGEVMAQLWDIN